VDKRCSVCGRVSGAARTLDWSAEIVHNDKASTIRWACADCTRANVRAIEAKLAQRWW
jgi:hypothetical protein